jgi:hypothetical protein
MIPHIQFYSDEGYPRNSIISSSGGFFKIKQHYWDVVAIENFCLKTFCNASKSFVSQDKAREI